MKRKKRLVIGAALLVIILLSGAAWGWCWMKGENLRFVQKMGNGINLGNTLEATNLWDYKPDADELDFEIFWGNPKVEPEQFDAIYEAGFRTVRIPVTWEDHIDANGTISKVWMERVQEVVDMALATDLYVIINTHHETWLDLKVEEEAEITERFSVVWRQIATHFSEYDEHLLFEGMNEPRLRDSEHEWDEGTPRMQEMVNQLNAAFVETVRDIHGNQDRYLLIGAYATSSFMKALKVLEIPKGHIIVSVHAYLPYQFCQNEDGNDEWSATNLQDTREIEEAFDNMHQLFVSKGIPVILSEYGCVDKMNLMSRTAWAEFYHKKAKEKGVACIWWDNGSTYQLLDREKGRWVYPEIVKTIVGR